MTVTVDMSFDGYRSEMVATVTETPGWFMRMLGKKPVTYAVFGGSTVWHRQDNGRRLDTFTEGLLADEYALRKFRQGGWRR